MGRIACHIPNQPVVKGKSIYRRKLRNQTSNIWTGARTVVRRVREKKVREES